MENRVAKLDKIREEYEQYSQLATTEKEKADAIMKELKDTVKGERRIAFGIALVAGIIVFLIGAVVGKYVRFP